MCSFCPSTAGGAISVTGRRQNGDKQARLGNKWIVKLIISLQHDGTLGANIDTVCAENRCNGTHTHTHTHTYTHTLTVYCTVC